MIRLFKTINLLIYTALCIGVAYYAFRYFFQLASPQNPFQQKLAGTAWVSSTHFVFGGLALLLTPFQLSRYLRHKLISWHRKIGYVYAFSVLLSGLAGLIMALNATGGWVAQLGFFSLACLWLLTTSLGVYHALKGDLRQHRIWIYRSVALTAAAITLRLMLGIGLGVMHWPFLSVYVPTAWLCWVLNLMLCEGLLAYQNRTQHRFSQNAVV